VTLREIGLHSPRLLFGRTVLRGVGQVFFQRSSLSGVAFLAAVALQSWTLSGACLLGALAGSGWGTRFGQPADLDAGLHGYNGALAGIGVMIVLAPGVMAWMLVIPAALLATCLAQVWRRRLALPPYTAPFVLVTWLLMNVAGVLGLSPAPALVAPDAGAWWSLQGVLRGAGQVMFLDDPRAGVLCLLGLALGSPRAAASALLASTLGLALAALAGFPVSAMALGLYGFNAVLTAEALRTAMPGRSGVWCLGVILSVGIMRGFQWLGVASLTAPFVLSVWAMLLIRSMGRRSRLAG